MGKPLWLLDIDGVINADFNSRGHARIWGNEIHQTSIFNHKIQYAPRLIKFINQISRHTEIMWCTTWGGRAETDFAPGVGLLGGWASIVDVTGEQSLELSSFGDKLVAFNALKSGGYLRGRKVVWADDDLNSSLAKSLKSGGDVDLLTVIPYGSVGLTPAHLDKITTFITS